MEKITTAGTTKEQFQEISWQRDLAERREKKRHRWYRDSLPDILFLNFFYWVIVSAVIAIAGMVITGCAENRDYLPWDRQSRTSHTFSTGEEVAAGGWFHPEDGETNPHDGEPPPPVTASSSLNGEVVVGSVRPAYPPGVMEDWCLDTRNDIEYWRQYLDPSFDWSSVSYVNPSRRASVIANLRGLVEHWESTCHGSR